MRLIVVTLVSLMLAFSLNAQPLNNIGPEVQSISAMSESSARMPRMARAPEMEPNVWTPWEAVVAILSSGQEGTNGVFAATYHIFTHLPYGSMVESWVRKPNGEVYLPSVSRSDITVPGGPWTWWVWNAPLPEDWPVGVTTFEVVVTINGKKYTAAAQVATGGVYPAGDAPKFGPLESASVDSSGGILLYGLFKTPPVAVAPTWLNQKIELEGDCYVPPGVMGTGSRPLSVCSGTDGDPNRLECTTKVVTIPVF